MNNSIFKNKFLELREKNDFVYLDYTGPQVAIFGYTKDGCILVEQVRNLIEKTTIKIPSGSGNINEEPKEGAQRESWEETGITVNDIDRFKKKYDLILCPNRFLKTVSVFHIFLNDSEVNAISNGKSHEIDKVHYVTFKKVKNLIFNNEIQVGQSREIILNFLLRMEEKNR